MWEFLGLLLVLLLGGGPLIAIIVAFNASRRVRKLESVVSSLESRLKRKPRDPDLLPASGPSTAPGEAADDRIPCPMCGDMVKPSATKCRHCLAFINVPTAPPEKPVETGDGAIYSLPIVEAQAEIVEPGKIPGPAKKVEKVGPGKEAGHLERVVGERIISGVGVLILVVGIALLLWYSYTHLGAVGKVALAGTTGMAMIGLGAFLGSRTRYLFPGGCLIAGGWAVSYATAYASHNVEAARVIFNPTLGFFLLLAIGAGSVLHALRFRKEWIAALAYGLLFITFFVFRVRDTALYALAPIALSFVLLIWKMRWIYLGTLGLAVLYLLLILSGGNDPGRSGIALVLLWGMMAVAQFLYRERAEVDQVINGIFGFLNMVGFVGCGIWLLDQNGYEQYWWLFASFGVVYAIKSDLCRRMESRGTYGVDMFGAVVLLSWAGWRFFPDQWISISWMVLALCTLLFGVGRKQAVPRFLANALLLVALFKTWALDHRMVDTFPVGAWDIYLRAIPAVIGAFCLYGHAAICSRLAGSSREESHLAGFILPWMGLISLGAAISVFAPSLGAALALSACALLLVEAGQKISSEQLRLQSFLFCLWAAGFFCLVNLTADGTVLGISKRLLASVPSLGIWYYIRRRLDLRGKRGRQADLVLSLVFLAALLSLLRFELGAAGTPLAWALVAGVWISCGMVSRNIPTLMEGVISSLAAIIFYASVSNPQIPLIGIGGTAGVGIPVAFLFVALHWWIRRGSASWESGWTPVMNLARGVMTLSMASSLFLVLARSVGGTWLTGSWALLSVGLAFYGFLLRDRMCRWSSLLVLSVCLGKLFFFDFPSFVMPVKIATTIAVGGCMLAISIVYARNRGVLTDYFTKE